jgi:NAD(P)-dependent dehydrogenase (short-subunit alcohol dehydrogenase family)
MEDFKSKVAVVAGSANPRGIGFAVCRQLADLGCRLVLADLDGEGAEARAKELSGGGVEAMGVRTDMSDRTSVEQLATTTFDRFGAAHIVLLNHVARSTGPGHGLLSPEPDQWEAHVQVNLLGVVYGIKAFVPPMIAGGEHGHVLATTSMAGASGTMYGNGPYSVTKAAIVSVMECLYGQLRDAGADIVAGLVFPGLTNTFPTDEISKQVVERIRSHGNPAVLAQPDDTATFIIESIRRDSFWAHPDIADDERLTGGRNRETLEWENGLYRSRAEALIQRSAPDPYLWGPPSDIQGDHLVHERRPMTF